MPSQPTPRALAAGAALLVLLVAVPVGLALVTGTGYVGGVVTALVLLVVADLAYAWRTNRWRAAVDRRTAAALERAGTRTEQVRETLLRLEDLQQDQRAATAASAETARAALVEVRLLRAVLLRPPGRPSAQEPESITDR